MDRLKLIDTLRDLKENRRLSSESEVIIKPFVGEKDSLSFIFLESSSTFSSRLDEKYSKGKTVLAKLADSELECTILFPPSENEWVEGLSKDDVFVSNVKVLALDNLYQRVVFGLDFQTNLEAVEEIEEDKANLKSILKIDANISEESETGDSEEKEIVSDFGNDEKTKATEKEISSVAIPGNLTEVSSEQIPVEREKLLGSEKGKVLEPQAIYKDELEDTETTGLQLKDTRNFANKGGKKNSKTEGKPPPIPSLKVQKKAKEIDFRELQRIRDKRYDEGADSLTDEENELLSLAKARSKLISIQNGNSNNARGSSRKRPSLTQKTEDTNLVTMGCRGIFGVVVGLFGLQALVRGWGIVAIISLGIAWYLLNPIINKLKEN